MRLAQLYIVGESREGPIKIGRSRSVQSRVAALQSGNPRRLEVFAVYTMDADDVILAESYLHEELERSAMVGEWFDLSADFIADYMPDFMLANGFEVRQ